jgi:hypothetical protein
MKIEIGKTYELNPAYKKSVVEVEHWHSHEHGDVDVTILWRWGTWYVTPQDKEEVKLLKQALKKDIQLHVNSFSDYEMRECFDGCSEDLEYDGDWTEEQFEAFKEEYYEDRWGTMDKYGFDQHDSDCYIHCEITLTEVEVKE